MQYWFLAGIIFLLIEMFTPLMFFLSFAVGCFFAGIVSILNFGLGFEILIFSITSFLIIFFIRPVFMKKRNGKTGMAEKYIGHEAQVIKKITKETGRIKIYGEEWEARSLANDIEEKKYVIIRRNESLIMYVEEGE